MEYWDLYDKNGCRTGLKIQRGQEIPAGNYHLCVEIWIMGTDGKFLIQKRSACKKVLPDIWGMTTGNALCGENGREACVREAKEELGIVLSKEMLVPALYIFREHTIWEVYFIRQDYDLSRAVLQEEEVSEAAWAGLDEIVRLLDRGEFYRYPEMDKMLEFAEQFQQGGRAPAVKMG